MSEIENKFKYIISRYTPVLWFFAMVDVVISPSGIFNEDSYSTIFWFFRKRSTEFVQESIRKEMKKKNTEYRRQLAFLRVKKE